MQKHGDFGVQVSEAESFVKEDVVPMIEITSECVVVSVNSAAKNYGINVTDEVAFSSWGAEFEDYDLGNVLFSHERVFRVQSNRSSVSQRQLWLTDITDIYSCCQSMIRKLEKAETEATTDAVTGIYNGRCFRALLGKEIEKRLRTKTPLGVAYLDLNDFKEVNDRWGHTAGDQILKVVGSILNDTVRSTDTAARIGGDEFAVLFPDTDHGGMRTVMARILNRIKDAMVEYESPVSASCGAVVFNSQPTDVDSVFRMIDKLMYAAKKQHKENKPLGKTDSNLATGVC